MTVTTIEFVDTSEEYGFFGKVVARSDVRGMTSAEIEAETTEMLSIVGDHCSARYVEEVAAS